MVNLEKIFQEIKDILKNNSQDFLETEQYLGSKAKTQKPGYHLYGTEEKIYFGRKPQQMYIAGVIQQKNYVSFYFTPIYSHPDSFKDISTELRKFLKGKSCFNINKTTPPLLEEIEEVLKKGIDMYKEIDWL
jgi:ATP-dependent phosphoenolpyruvate carboxykinase